MRIYINLHMRLCKLCLGVLTVAYGSENLDLHIEIWKANTIVVQMWMTSDAHQLHVGSMAWIPSDFNSANLMSGQMEFSSLLKWFYTEISRADMHKLFRF
jgi:hypothetical protein